MLKSFFMNKNLSYDYKSLVILYSLFSVCLN